MLIVGNKIMHRVTALTAPIQWSELLQSMKLECRIISDNTGACTRTLGGRPTTDVGHGVRVDFQREVTSQIGWER